VPGGHSWTTEDDAEPAALPAGRGMTVPCSSEVQRPEHATAILSSHRRRTALHRCHGAAPVVLIKEECRVPFACPNEIKTTDIEQHQDDEETSSDHDRSS